MGVISSSRSLWSAFLLGGLALLSVTACVEDSTSATPLVAGPHCGGDLVDLTDPQVSAVIADRPLELAGPATVEQVGKRRISRAPLRFKDDVHVGASHKPKPPEGPGEVGIECVMTCEGAGCTPIGCDATETRCTLFICSGNLCDGDCEMRYVLFP